MPLQYNDDSSGNGIRSIYSLLRGTTRYTIPPLLYTLCMTFLKFLS